MELAIAKPNIIPSLDSFVEIVRELNLIYNASGAANEMVFKNGAELEGAVTRAIGLCVQAGFPIEGNFKKIYLCSDDGIYYDWKLSTMAYYMVCLNGGEFNPNVARMQLGLVKRKYIND